jgi:GGDEF domain-containing protein
MPRSPYIVYFSRAAEPAPEGVRRFAAATNHRVVELRHLDDVLETIGRAYPAAIVVEVGDSPEDALNLCRIVKSEVFTAIVPVVFYLNGRGALDTADALEAGADDVLTPTTPPRESDLRLRLAIERVQRDVSVHPTTLLPGTVQIERDQWERIRSGEPFAVCYADLDYFKEFNDRYGYARGDRVIWITSRILRDVVRAHSPRAFIGHIGGDDFVFHVPVEDMRRCCEDVIDVFDVLIPWQYDEEDRARGYFLGKDRRGHEYRVPLMSISIGVVTNERRRLVHPAQIAAIVTEMKAYAKTLPGSTYAVDRRADPDL